MIYLLLTSLIWAFSFGLIGSVLKGLDPMMVASARLIIAMVVFLPLLRLRNIQDRDRLHLLGIGSIQFGVMYICYLSAFRFAPSHLIALFSVLTPVYVVLIHDLKQRSFTPRYLLAAILSVGGAAVIKAKGGDSDSVWAAFLLMQISGMAFAFGQVAYRDWARAKREEIGKAAMREHEAFALLYAGGAATALIASLFLSPEPLAFIQASPAQLGVIVYLGAIASGLGFFLWNKGASLSSPGVLAAFNNVLVPLAIIVSLFVFGEIAEASTGGLIRLAIGAALIAAAVSIGKGNKIQTSSL